MNKIKAFVKTSKGKLVCMVFIVVIFIAIIRVQKVLKIRSVYNPIISELNWIESYKTRGYKDSELVIKVNKQYEALSKEEKSKWLTKLHDLIPVAAWSVHHNIDTYKEVESEKIIVKNNDKVEKYNLYNVDDLGDYEEVKFDEPNSGTNNDNTNTTKFSDNELISYAQYCVKEKLKSPSTAKFANVSEFKITKQDDGILIAGYVNSQNGFGAMIRTNFEVLLSLDGNSCINVNFY